MKLNVPEMPRGMPIKNTSIFPEMGYDAGKLGEFDYRIPKNYAEGGDLEADIMPMDAGIGGMTKTGMNDKELISSAIDVLQGEIIEPNQQRVILAQFVQEFGQDALQDLIQKVQSGEIPQVPSEGDGMVKGAGDGMDDMIPANLKGDQDVLFLQEQDWALQIHFMEEEVVETLQNRHPHMPLVVKQILVVVEQQVVKDKDLVFEETNEGMLGAKSQDRSWSSDICSQSSSLGSFDGVGKTRGKT